MSAYRGCLTLGSRVRPTVGASFGNLVLCLEVGECLGDELSEGYPQWARCILLARVDRSKHKSIIGSIEFTINNVTRIAGLSQSGKLGNRFKEDNSFVNQEDYNVEELVSSVLQR